MTKGKYLAIDFGDKRVGIAISDLNKEIAFPRETLVFRSFSHLLEQLQALFQQEPVVKIVVGLPIEMDGTWGERAKKTAHFITKLQSAFPDLPVDYFDERLTTLQAEKILRQKGLKSHQQKGQKDSIAAQKILEAYLASQRK